MIGDMPSSKKRFCFVEGLRIYSPKSRHEPPHQQQLPRLSLKRYLGSFFLAQGLRLKLTKPACPVERHLGLM